MTAPETASSLRVAMIDDHQMFLVGIRHLLGGAETGFSVSCFGSGFDLLAAFDAGESFDVIVTDLTMKDLNGLALISSIRQRGIQTPAIVLSASEDAIARSHSELIGAFQFVHKSSDPEVLSDAILKAAEAGNLRAHELRRTASREIEDSNGEDQVVVPRLAPKQREILLLVAKGLTNQQIADTLCISENTVKSHAKVIFRELGVNTRTAAAQRARELALI